MKSGARLAAGILTYLTVGAWLAPFSLGQASQVDSQTTVAVGWHPWYEIKADPGDPQKLIICGTRWDAESNAALGFVYASQDTGRTWKSVLEDRHTSWVTEQSCAFGPQHRAYFISEASQVIDGQTHHDSGTARLYVSQDSGQHWTQTIETGWADYSTSAVASTSGRLYTFFNVIADEPGRSRVSNVGLLVFSADGKAVSGPFFDRALEQRGFEGSFPTDAMALRNGGIVALYFGTRRTKSGLKATLGIVRVDAGMEPTLESTTILDADADRDCFHLNNSSLAYDVRENRLLVVYEAGCTDPSMMLTSSADEGKTWTKAQSVTGPEYPVHATNPSLVAGPGGIVGLLWEEGQSSGRWFFSYIRNQELYGPRMELSSGAQDGEVTDDTLLTWAYPPNSYEGEGGDLNAASEPAIRLNVGNALNVVWRTSGLITEGDKMLAVWPSADDTGMRLSSRVLPGVDAAPGPGSSTPATDGSDVTSQTVILYGGLQHFDRGKSNLEVCLALGNRGSKPLRVPIKLEAEDIRSRTGIASALNASNGLQGPGAIWDISSSVTGDQIPPHSDSNPFCLSFHLDVSRKDMSLPEAVALLSLKMRILATE